MKTYLCTVNFTQKIAPKGQQALIWFNYNIVDYVCLVIWYYDQSQMWDLGEKSMYYDF